MTSLRFGWDQAVCVCMCVVFCVRLYGLTEMFDQMKDWKSLLLCVLFQSSFRFQDILFNVQSAVYSETEVCGTDGDLCACVCMCCPGGWG